jgi:hypothetical protein
MRVFILFICVVSFYFLGSKWPLDVIAGLEL